MAVQWPVHTSSVPACRLQVCAAGDAGGAHSVRRKGCCATAGQGLARRSRKEGCPGRGGACGPRLPAHMLPAHNEVSHAPSRPSTHPSTRPRHAQALPALHLAPRRPPAAAAAAAACGHHSVPCGRPVGDGTPPRHRRNVSQWSACGAAAHRKRSLPGAGDVPLSPAGGARALAPAPLQRQRWNACCCAAARNACAGLAAHCLNRIPPPGSGTPHSSFFTALPLSSTAP